MTSTKLRNRRSSFPSEFPCTKMVQRLHQVKDFSKVCVASIDKISFKIKEPREHFGKESFFEKELAKTGGVKGWTYHYKRNFVYEEQQHLIHFQIYIRAGSTDRTLLVNPRHFLNFDKPIFAFELFLQQLLNLKNAKTTRIDISFQIQRHLVSCDFFKWSMYMEDVYVSTINEEPYTNETHAKVAKAKLESYRIGKKPLSVQAYDCDAKTSKGKTKHIEEFLEMKNVYNLEFRLGNTHDIVKNVKTVQDIFNIDVASALEKVHFVDPSGVNRLDETKYRHIKNIWQERGILFARRQAYPISKNYETFDCHTNPLKIQRGTFKQALIDLAKRDFFQYRSSKLSPDRRQEKRNMYLMPVLFSTEAFGRR